MRDRSIVGEVFFVKIVFLEKRNDRTRFELIWKDTRGERKVYDASQGRSECRNRIKIRERVG